MTTEGAAPRGSTFRKVFFPTNPSWLWIVAAFLLFDLLRRFLPTPFSIIAKGASAIVLAVPCGILLHEIGHLLGALVAGYKIQRLQWGSGKELLFVRLLGFSFSVHSRPCCGMVFSVAVRQTIAKEFAFVFGPLLVGGVLLALSLRFDDELGVFKRMFLISTAIQALGAFFYSPKKPHPITARMLYDIQRVKILLRALRSPALAAGPRASKALKCWEAEPRAALALLEEEWGERRGENVWCWPLTPQYLPTPAVVGLHAALRVRDMEAAGRWSERLWSLDPATVQGQWRSIAQLFILTAQEEAKRLRGKGQESEAEELLEKAALEESRLSHIGPAASGEQPASPAL